MIFMGYVSFRSTIFGAVSILSSFFFAKDGKEGGEETKEEESKTEDFERFLISGDVKGSSFLHLVVSLGRPLNCRPKWSHFYFFLWQKDDGHRLIKVYQTLSRICRMLRWRNR